MNLDPPSEFDPSAALACLGETEAYGLSTRVWFYLLATCRAVESLSAPVFTIESIHEPKNNAVAGCGVRFVVRRHEFLVDVYERVRLWASEADEPDGNRWLVYDGTADNPTSWEALLREVGHVERFGVLINHGDALRRMWTEWLAERKRRRDERGW
jgi:hypothetical protein